MFTYAKIQIWKQFTTLESIRISDIKLCLPMQRYKFESNSQQAHEGNIQQIRCVYLCKDTNLKAIHNIIKLSSPPETVVFTYAKIQIWKQFTTCSVTVGCGLKLCLPMQRYKFESNSQLVTLYYREFVSCVYLCKDTNLKAIHNYRTSVPLM